MRREENHMSRYVGMPHATCAWAIVLGLIMLVMAGPTSAQPVDVPATWGATSGTARGSPAAGWTAGRVRKERRGAGHRPSC